MPSLDPLRTGARRADAAARVRREAPPLRDRGCGVKRGRRPPLMAPGYSPVAFNGQLYDGYLRSAVDLGQQYTRKFAALALDPPPRSTRRPRRRIPPHGLEDRSFRRGPCPRRGATTRARRDSRELRACRRPHRGRPPVRDRRPQAALSTRRRRVRGGCRQYRRRHGGRRPRADRLRARARRPGHRRRRRRRRKSIAPKARARKSRCAS